MPTIVSVELGGTGANNIAEARAALGVASSSVSNAAYSQANSAYDQANTATTNAGNAYNQANSAYSVANTAQTTAQNAYGQANNSYEQANSAYNQANTATTNAGNANSLANSAYAQANTATTIAGDAYGQANAAYIQANTATTNAANAHTQANTARDQANSAYTQANNAYGQANLAYTQANNAYGQANLAYTQANNAYAEANLKLNLTGGTINGSLNVSGNLTITGNTKYTNVDTYIVSDPLIYLAANNNLSDLVDIGFLGAHNTAGIYQHSGLARDAGDGTWYLFTGLPSGGHDNNVVDFANTSLATLRANINANSILLTGSPVATQANLTLAHNQANNAYNEANNKVSSVSGTSGRITSSGGLTPTIDLVTAGAGSASYSSGISALSVDAYGRVTSVTGSAGYATTSSLSSYLQLAGGTLTGVLNSSATSLALNTTTPGTGTYHLNFTGQSTSDYAHGITWGWSTNGAQAGIYVQSSGSYGTKMFLATTDAFVSGSKTALSIDHNGVVNAVRGALQQGGNQVLHAGNYNSYAPSLTGASASGTWGINITGSSGSSPSLTLTQLNTATVNVNNSSTAVYRNENGSGAVISFAPVLHIGGGDTMWQMQGTYGTSGNGTLYFRQGYNGSWGTWLSMLSSANYNSYAPTLTGSGASGTWGISISGNAGTVTNGVYQNQYGSFQSSFTIDINANTNRNVGAYGSYASGATNAPTNAGILLNFTSGSDGSSDGAQLWMSFSSRELYGRQRWGGSWQAWNTYLSATNYNSYAPTLTGGGASGTWGISITGNAATVGNLTPTQVFNNMGDNHGTRSSFDASTPSYGFGYRYIVGNANGPGTGGNQYYSWYIGLGNEYPATGGGSYGMMFAIERDVATPYLSVRYNEANSFSSWRKVAAGYADSAGAVDFNNLTNKTSGTGVYTTSGDFRAPIFYDSNDTNYYSDPAGTSLVSAITARSNLQVYNTSGGDWAWLYLRGVRGQVGIHHGGSNADASTDLRFAFYNADGSWYDNRFHFYKNGDFWMKGTTLTIGEGTFTNINMTDSDEGTRTIHCNSNRIGFLNQSGGWGAYCNDDGSWQTDHAVWTPILYDLNDSGYYLNPNGTSSLYALATAGQISARYGQSVGTMLTSTGGLGGIEVYSGGAGNAAFINFHKPGNWASYFGLDTDNQFAVGGWSAGAALAHFKCQGLGVGTASSGTTGEIRATNNITAYYSDSRLKEIKGKITNAVNKVMQLNGYYYVENELAESFGYSNKEEQVGVSAQEVEAVLPHVVAAAPFDIAKDEDGKEYSKSGENYKTVRYERLVPLLIEAIKELNIKIERLESKLGDK